MSLTWMLTILNCSIRLITIFSFITQVAPLFDNQIQTTSILLKNSSDFEEIIEQIQHAGTGTNYYQPMGTRDRQLLGGKLPPKKTDARE
jgi:hypothetical protein